MKCIVQNCRNVWNPTGNVKFHRFPNDPALRKSWLSIVPIKGNFYKSARICSLHFKAEDYDPDRPGYLQTGAKPFYATQPCDCQITNPTDYEDQIESQLLQRPPKRLKKDNENSVPQNEFSWQRPIEATLASDDENTYEDFEDNLSLYCEDESDRPTVVNSDGKTHDNHIDHEYACNFCSESITGFRYRCVQCADYDLCVRCETAGCHPEHYMLRVPPDRPRAEVLSVLSRIRSQLLGGDNPLLTGDALVDSVKEEVKEEEEQCEPHPLRAEESQPRAESVERARPHHEDADQELPAEASDVQEHRTPPLERLLYRQRERSVSPQECGEDGLCEVPDGLDPLRPHITPVASDYTSPRKRKRKDMDTSSNTKRKITPDPQSFTAEKERSVSPQECVDDGLCDRPVVLDSLRPHVLPVASKDTSLRKRKPNDTKTSSNPKRPVTPDPVSLLTQHLQPVVVLNKCNLKNIIRIKKSQLVKTALDLTDCSGSQLIQLLVQQPMGSDTSSQHRPIL